MWPFRKSAPAPIQRAEPVITAPNAPARGRRYAAASGKVRFADLRGSGRSADAELNQSLGTLREMSRKLERDNPHAQRYFQLREDNIIGARGFAFNSRATLADGVTLDKVTNDRVEWAWWKWCQRPTVCGTMSIVDALKLIDVSRARDGDVFIELVRGGKHTDRLAFQIWEADMVDETLNRSADGANNRIKMGVELDDENRPVAYHFLTYHRGDNDWSVKNRARRRVPAERIIHVMKRKRAGQTRGAPDMTGVMNLLGMIDGYRDAEVTNRRVRSGVSGFFKRDQSAAGDSIDRMSDTEDDEGPGEMYIEAGMFRGLPPGWSLEKFDPTNTGADYDVFEKAALRAVASGLGISYIGLTGDLNETSYSGGRQAMLDDRERWDNEQTFLISHVLARIFAMWLNQWIGLSDGSAPVSKRAKILEGVTFAGRRWTWIDPSKDVAAAKMEVDSGFTSYSAIARERGLDFADVVQELSADMEMIRDAKLKIGEQDAEREPGSDDPAGEGDENSGGERPSD